MSNTCVVEFSKVNIWKWCDSMSIFPWEDIKTQRVGEGHRYLQTTANVQKNKNCHKIKIWKEQKKLGHNSS